MGTSLGTGGSSNRRRYRKQRFTEINVTPMVDVMLVLLIIFMVTAPMLTAGIQVDLPKTNSKPLAGTDEPLTVSIQSNGDIILNKTKMTIAELSAKMKSVAAEKSDSRVFVRGDKNVDYGRVMHVVGAINEAGITKVALITEQTGESDHHRGK